MHVKFQTYRRVVDQTTLFRQNMCSHLAKQKSLILQIQREQTKSLEKEMQRKLRAEEYDMLMPSYIIITFGGKSNDHRIEKRIQEKVNKKSTKI